jgi:acyl-coenzyme A thioesterase PaaI-like protein
MDISLQALEQAGEEYLPGLIGIEFDGFEDGVMRAHLDLRKAHFAPNGGTISCEGRLVRGGRTTQLWDATVTVPRAARWRSSAARNSCSANGVDLT